MRSKIIIILLPTLLFAQAPEFELQPEAFPVEITGWQPHCPWAGGMDATTPDFCDIDNDGDLDFFCGDARGFVNFFRNIGNPWQPDFQYVTFILDSMQAPSVVVGGGKSDIDFVDMDGDYDLDACLGSGYTLIYLNIGTMTQPSFSLDPDTLRDTSGEYVLGPRISMSDIDADGDYDLFAGQINGNIRFYENVGNSIAYEFALSNENWFNIQVGYGYTKPCFNDLDFDSDLDLLIGTGEGNIYFYRNDGDSANPQMTYVTGNYFNIDVQEDASPELVDIDNDGDLDLFVGRSPSSAAIDHTQGDVYFYENVGTPQEPVFQYRTSNYLTYDNGMHAHPNLVDIDADGDPDLFSRVGYTLLFFRNQGSLIDPFFVYESDNFANIEVSTPKPWFCDIDSDGDYDLFCGTAAIPGPPGLYLFINRGTPQVPDFTLYSSNLVPDVFTQTMVNTIPSTADIDADGDYDLFVSGSNGYYYFFENTGTPTEFQFQFVDSTWQGVSDPSQGHRLHCFFDIDDDSDLDLFISSTSYYTLPWDKNLQFYRNLGTPQNAIMQLENEDLFPEFMIWQAAPYLLDIDQDGDGDLFVGDSWGGIRFFRNVTGEPPAVRPKVVSPYRGPVLTLGPNPANPVTWVTFNLPAPQKATLAVYNLLGRKVAILAQGLQPAGTNIYLWNASQFSSGVYIIRLETEKEDFVSRITVLK